MNIAVNTLGGQVEIFEVALNSEVADLKQEIAVRLGVPAPRQRLISEGVELRDSDLLVFSSEFEPPSILLVRISALGLLLERVGLSGCSLKEYVGVKQAAGHVDDLFLFAVRQGDYEAAFEIVVNSEYDPNTSYGSHATCLHYILELARTAFGSARHVFANACIAILDRDDFSAVNEINSNNETALHLASRSGLARVCEALLSHPKFFVANVAEDFRRTALHVAVLHMHVDCALAILASTIFDNVHASDNLGRDALEICIGSCSGCRGLEAVCESILNRDDFKWVLRNDSGTPTTTPIDGQQRAARVLGLALKSCSPKICMSVLEKVQFDESVLNSNLLSDTSGYDGNAYTWSMLHLAARKETLSSVFKAILWSNGFNRINAVEPCTGKSVLHVAAAKGHAQACEMLLVHDEFMLINATTKLGETALHEAAAAGQVIVCSMLLANPQFDAIDVADKSGQTALHNSAASGSVDVSRVLLGSQRVNITTINKTSNSGLTALHLAAEVGSMSICEDLIKYSADVNIVDENGSLALHYALTRGADALSVCMLAHPEFHAINATSAEGRTLLHVASAGGCPDSCCEILHQPCFEELNRQDSSGSTVLHAAASAGLSEVCGRILAHPKFCSADLLDNYGMTALHIAAGAQKAKAALAIIEADAFTALDSHDSDGTTALEYAAVNKMSEVSEAISKKLSESLASNERKQK